jgi:hypothetical protein
MSTPLLLRRSTHHLRSQDQAIEAAGGLWRVMRPFEPNELAAAVERTGVRALSVGAEDCAWLAPIADLEFLSIWGTPDASAFPRMERLRGLTFDSGWVGRIDFALAPNLEWLFIGGGDRRRNGGLDTLFAGHPTVRRIHIAGYQGTDLRPFARLPALERVELVAGRRLTSLEGTADLAPSMTELKLATCPRIDSIAGIEALSGLRYLNFEACNRIRDLAPASLVDGLTYLSAGLPKGIESLRPFAGHPSLEYLLVSRVLDGDFTPLQTMPRLRSVTVPPQFTVPPGPYRDLREYDESDPIRVRAVQLAVG